ncbi:MAG: hypothetical protein O7E50_08435, partial [Gemmatimonadetes bacterium]|nr:hypothetical protein [Gemmatimonadota bacterium]
MRHPGNGSTGDNDGGSPSPIRPTPVREVMSQPPRPVTSQPPPPVTSTDLQILLVRFKGLREEFFSFRSAAPAREREYVIVEASRGQDLGWVKRAIDAASHKCGGGCDDVADRPVVPPSENVIRRASPADVRRAKELRAEEDDV